MIYLMVFAIILGLSYALVSANTKFEQLKQQNIVNQQLLQEADLKYGGLISTEQLKLELEKEINSLNEKLRNLHKEAEQEEYSLALKLSGLKQDLEELEEKSFLESFGFYESKYNFGDSSQYQEKLNQIQALQKQMLKAKTAAICHAAWQVEGSVKKGQKMTNDFLTLVLRAFNGECDAAISKIKYNNVQTMENRVRKSYEKINKLSETTHCEITPRYLDLKLQELWLTYEYQEQKYQEQEEQRLIREQMREEEKAKRELEKIKQEAEKEENRYQKALDKARKEIEASTGQAYEKLQTKIQELQEKLNEASQNKERAISQAQLTKTGHVYIISNIGSFGEDIYKIGLTRRLEPAERVQELSNASVPFPFDIHAMIYSENAPELESSLHKYFEGRRVNKANSRKEFFRVSLDEIVEAVGQIDQQLNISKSEIKFTKVAEAADYRKTLAYERKMAEET